MHYYRGKEDDSESGWGQCVRSWSLAGTAEEAKILDMSMKERPHRKRKRINGAGRPTALTSAQEQELKNWVLGRRRYAERHAVSEKEIKQKARDGQLTNHPRKNGAFLQELTTVRSLAANN